MLKKINLQPQLHDLSELVSRIISSEVKILANFTLARMSKEDLITIKKIVKRTIQVEKSAEMGKAILALTQRESSAEVAKILGDIFSQKNADRNEKVIAAKSLAQMPHKSAEKVLLDNLNIKDSLIRNSIIWALGAVGGSDTLERLKKLSSPKISFRQQQLNFSKTLIAHRLDDPKDYLNFEKGVERRVGKKANLLDLSLKLLPKKKIQQVIDSLSSRNTYNIKISESTGFDISIGNANWVFLVNKDLQDNKFFNGFLKRKYIVGLLARKNKSHNHFAIQYIVLSNPSAREVKILVVRTDGEICYSGNAITKDETILLSLKDVDRPGTMATNVEGELTKQGFEITKSILFGIRNKMKGEAINTQKVSAFEEV